MTTREQRANPRRKSKDGRSARNAKIRKAALYAKTQVQHKGFRKTNPSLIYVAPANGYAAGYVILFNLLGHAEMHITFDKADTIIQDVRNGKNRFPETHMKGGETLKVYIKPLEDTATVKNIYIGILFKEQKDA